MLRTFPNCSGLPTHRRPMGLANLSCAAAEALTRCHCYQNPSECDFVGYSCIIHTIAPKTTHCTVETAI